MEQNSAIKEELILLSDCLGQGIEQQWSHELKKQILLLLHRLKTISRKLTNTKIEAELLAIEVTMGYGTGSGNKPDIALIEDHQIRLLELADANELITESQPAAEEPVAEVAVIEERVAEEASNIHLLLCNCPGRDVARELAHGLVKVRLAACVNIIANIGSVYWWQGEIKDTAECQLQIKTSRERLHEVIEFLKQNHQDDVPEVLAITVTEGNKDYFDWVKQETNDTKDD